MVSEKIISLRDALKVFSLRDANKMFKPFDLVYRTFNQTTKKGGKHIVYKGVRYLPSAKNDSLKNPNHFKNRTRNIELANGSIKTIIIDFIIKVNDKTVIY